MSGNRVPGTACRWRLGLACAGAGCPHLSVLRAASVSERVSGPALRPVSPVFAGEYVRGSCGGYGEGESW